MKNKIKYALLLMLIACTSRTFGQQQMPRTPEEKAQRQTMWMQKNLALTEEQNRKVYDILLYRAREVENEKSMAPGPEKKMDKKDLKRDINAELKAVPTPDQFSRYRQHEEEQKARRRARKAEMTGY